MQSILIIDKIIWECTVYDTIIPEKCKLYAEVGWNVQLKKKNPGIWRAPFSDKMVWKFVQ